ncbi:MAG: hypothetical protein KDK65_06570, partial [Chlamydiia bacterium]|nr:hypothetical protein [Chlamydiia bacterium]
MSIPPAKNNTGTPGISLVTSIARIPSKYAADGLSPFRLIRSCTISSGTPFGTSNSPITSGTHTATAFTPLLPINATAPPRDRPNNATSCTPCSLTHAKTPSKPLNYTSTLPPPTHTQPTNTQTQHHKK